MSVVHIQDRSTEDEKTFGSSAMSDRSLLLLSPLKKAQGFAVELTVGQAWSEKYGPKSNQMNSISESGILLGRHGSIVVEAAEFMKVPHNLYGILVPTGSLFLDKGILIAPAKVEPSFTGNLKLRMFNTTSLKHTLKKGDKLGSVIFFGTETTRYQAEVTKKGVLIPTEIPAGIRLMRWLSKNANQLVTWFVALLGGSTMAAILVHFVLTPYFPRPEAAVTKPPAVQQDKKTN